MRDLASRVAISSAHFPAILTASPTAVTVDRRGFESVTLALLTGIGGITFNGSNKLEWVIEHSDDASEWSAVVAAEVRGNAGQSITVAAGGIVEAYVAAKAAVSVNHYAYVGHRRYVRATPTFGGTHSTGTTVGSVVILGDPEQAAVA